VSLGYITRRCGTFVLIVWLATTVNFVLPRIATPELSRPRGEPGSPFLLDRPLWEQYTAYLGNLAHFDLNYSMSSYPSRVTDQIGYAPVNLPPFPLVADARLTAALHDRRKARDDQVLALHEQGASLASIAHRLDLTRSTVRRIVRAGAAMAAARARRASSIRVGLCQSRGLPVRKPD
jgi:Helix-turn-helix domain of resolvase